MKSFHLLFFFLLLFTTSATSTLIAGNKLTISINETHLNTRVFCCPPFATQVLALMNMANRKGQHRDDPFFFYLLFLCYFSRLVPLTFAYFVVEIKRVNLSLKIMFEIGHRDTRDCSRGKEVRKKKQHSKHRQLLIFNCFDSSSYFSYFDCEPLDLIDGCRLTAHARHVYANWRTDLPLPDKQTNRKSKKKNEWQLPQVEQHLAFA